MICWTVILSWCYRSMVSSLLLAKRPSHAVHGSDQQVAFKRRFGFALLAIILPVASTGCSNPDDWISPVSSAVEVDDASPVESGTVNTRGDGWPRTVEMANGSIRLPRPPTRILSLSLGHDEILLSLVSLDRMVGVAAPTADPALSNVAQLVQGKPAVSADAETVIDLNPDLVLVSSFTRQDVVDLIEGAGITVVRIPLNNSIDGHKSDIHLIGRILGAETQAKVLAAEIERRISRVRELTDSVPIDQRPRVLAITRYSDSLWVAGSGSTEGGILESAGVVNVAAQHGISGNQIISAESIIRMAPEVIIITQGEPGASEFRHDLLHDRAMRDVPAVSYQRVFIGDPRYYTTLSHWNVRGMEETARMAFPDIFRGKVFGDFQTPGE